MKVWELKGIMNQGHDWFFFLFWVRCFFDWNLINLCIVLRIKVDCGRGWFFRWEEWRVSLRSQDRMLLRRRMV